MEIHWLSNKEKVPGSAVIEEDHVDSILGQERAHHNWFPWKKYICKKYILLLTPLPKFTLLN